MVTRKHRFNLYKIKDADLLEEAKSVIAMLYLTLDENTFRRILKEIMSLTQHVGEKFLCGIYKNHEEHEDLYFEVPNFGRCEHKELFLKVTYDYMEAYANKSNILNILEGINLEEDSCEKKAIMRFLFKRLNLIIKDVEEELSEENNHN